MPPEDGQVRVDTLLSGLSVGTELTLVKGSNPYLHASYDAAAGVLREGAPARRYPVQSMGYMEVARVVESRPPAVAVGDVVRSTTATGPVMSGTGEQRGHRAARRARLGEVGLDALHHAERVGQLPPDRHLVGHLAAAVRDQCHAQELGDRSAALTCLDLVEHPVDERIVGLGHQVAVDG